MNHQKNLECKKQLIIEEYGAFLEKHEKLAPVAARIVSLLLIDNRNALTFDELLHSLHASKSTVSTNLKHLEDAGFVEYFTKSCDRKRHFQLSKSACKIRQDEMLKLFKAELRILKKIINYKSEINQFSDSSNQNHLKGNEVQYSEYLTDLIEFLSQHTS